MAGAKRKLAFGYTFHREGAAMPMVVRVYLPVESAPHPKHGGTHWRADFEVERDGKKHSTYAGGESWWQAIRLAVEGVRALHIPVAEEDEWRTAEGIPVWIAMPREVSIAWGHAAYRHACQQLDFSVKRAQRGEFRGRD